MNAHKKWSCKKLKGIVACLLTGSLLFGLFGCGGGSSTRFTAFNASPDAGLSLLSSKIDKQYVTDIADKLEACADMGGVGYCTAGSTTAANAASIIGDEMRKIGLNDIDKQSFTADGMFVSQAAISVKTGSGTAKYAIGLFPAASSVLAGGQPYEIVFCGKGTKTDYGKVAMSQKIALVICDDRSIGNVEYIIETAKENGAVGVILSCAKATNPDSSSSVFSGAYPTVGTGISAFSMAYKDAAYLATLCNSATAASVITPATATTALKIAAKSVMVTFDLQYNSLTDQKAINVSGIIKGTDPRSAIVVGSSYDHLLQGYNENCMSTALMLGLAKAIKDSGYVTQRSIIFTAYSGSVFSKIGDPLSSNGGLSDWLKNIPKSYPKNILYGLYIDLPSIDLGDTYPLAVSVGMADQTNHLISGLSSAQYPSGVTVGEIYRSDCPQFLFGEQGIPSIGLALTKTTAADMIGSAADNKANFNPQALDFSAKLYARLLTGLDQTVLLPISFGPFLRTGASLMLGNQKQPSSDIAPCYNTTLDVADNFERLSAEVVSINDAYASAVLTRNTAKVEAIYSKSDDINQTLKELYQRIQTGCMVTDYNSTLYNTFMPALTNTTGLSSALTALRAKNMTSAVAALNSVDTNYKMQSYSASVCQNVYGIYQSMTAAQMVYAFNRTYNQAENFGVYEGIDALAAAKSTAVTEGQIQVISNSLDDQRRELKMSLSAWRAAIGLAKTRAQTIVGGLNELENTR